MLYIIRFSNGAWNGRAYARKGDAIRLIKSRAKYSNYWRNASIYEVDIDKYAELILTAEHSTITTQVKAWNGALIPNTYTTTTFNENTQKTEQKIEENLSDI